MFTTTATVATTTTTLGCVCPAPQQLLSSSSSPPPMPRHHRRSASVPESACLASTAVLFSPPGQKKEEKEATTTSSMPRSRARQMAVAVAAAIASEQQQETKATAAKAAFDMRCMQQQLEEAAAHAKTERVRLWKLAYSKAREAYAEHEAKLRVKLRESVIASRHYVQHLDTKAAINDGQPETHGLSSPLNSTTSAHRVIPFRAYAERVALYGGVSAAAWTLALIYAHRMEADKTFPAVRIMRRSQHRILAVTTLLATKFYDDVFHKNSVMAKVYGFTTEETNELEVYGLATLLKWRLQPTQEELEGIAATGDCGGDGVWMDRDNSLTDAVEKVIRDKRAEWEAKWSKGPGDCYIKDEVAAAALSPAAVCSCY